jgi:hypothetical protein
VVRPKNDIIKSLSTKNRDEFEEMIYLNPIIIDVINKQFDRWGCKKFMNYNGKIQDMFARVEKYLDRFLLL